MNDMLNESGISFKELEKKIFAAACEGARKTMQDILEGYDNYLMENRDTGKYRNKGLRETVIKTVFGEVVYSRHIYSCMNEYGLKEYHYLLDEMLDIARVGKFSENMADILVSKVCEDSYRVSAKETGQMTGQVISHTGVWNIIQALGKRCEEQGTELVKAHKKGRIRGKERTEVLFEEADGIWLSLQREKHKSGELKAGIAYNGWRETGKGRYELSGKVTVCTMGKSREFRELFEAAIAERYDTDEIDIRLINADGAGWTKNICGLGDVFQLDPFHRNRAIRECLPYPEARDAVHGYLRGGDMDGLFRYLEIYRDSVADEEETEKAEELIRYLKNNRDGLIPYRERSLDIPEAGNGLTFRGMGTMEGHNWSVIAKRMKRNHTSWSIKGAGNLARILAKRDCGRLGEVCERIEGGRFEEAGIAEIEEIISSAGSVPLKIGKGYEYPVRGSLPRFEGPTGPVSARYKSYLTGF